MNRLYYASAFLLGVIIAVIVTQVSPSPYATRRIAERSIHLSSESIEPSAHREDRDKTKQVKHQPPDKTNTAAKESPLRPTRSPSLTNDRNSDFFFENGKVLDERIIPSQSIAHYTRERLIQVSFRYPLLRVKEEVSRDPSGTQETVVHRESYVADHVVVKALTGTSRADIHTVAAHHGL
ncbi:MAG: hypothetical protein KDD60_10560, partial [Bdellovibrionales bacterium]|nr:hypothetical protein [Bdellovibrionales bacterium]